MQKGHPYLQCNDIFYVGKRDTMQTLRHASKAAAVSKSLWLARGVTVLLLCTTWYKWDHPFDHPKLMIGTLDHIGPFFSQKEGGTKRQEMTPFHTPMMRLCGASSARIRVSTMASCWSNQSRRKTQNILEISGVWVEYIVIICNNANYNGNINM